MTPLATGVPTQTQRPGASGRWWLVPVGLLIAMVAGQVFMVVLAVRDPSFAVESDYYRKGVTWDEAEGRAARSRELGWKLALDPKVPASTLQLTVADGKGNPVTGLEANARTFHLAHAAGAKELALREIAPGIYNTERPAPVPGLWEIRFRADRGKEHFEATLRHELPREPKP